MAKFQAATKVDASLLWDLIHAHGQRFRCEVEDALGFRRAKVATCSRYLLQETGQDVILPSGMSTEAHTSPLTGEDCRCGALRLNYSAPVAKAWHHRRLVTLKGHAESIFDIGAQLASQFPDSTIMSRLTEDARRVREDVTLALGEIQ